jgi:SAM-dependent methyltransferase
MANEAMRENWTNWADGWVVHRELFDFELAGFATAVLDRLQPGAGDRVLDVGCGTGVLLEAIVAAGGAAVGVDISPVMVEAARERVPEATVVLGDAQTDDLGRFGPFSAVVSRFGVMFFDDPVAAFTNIRSATQPGGRLVFACWRGIEENPMFTLGTSVLAAHVGPRPEVAPDAPGPMAFADRERVRSILDAAGWRTVEVEPIDVECNYGLHGSDGVEERLVMILNTTGGRMAREQLEHTLGPAGWEAVLDEVRKELRANLVDGVVKFNGAGWLVTGANP